MEVAVQKPDLGPNWFIAYDFHEGWTTSILYHVGPSGIVTIASVTRTDADAVQPKGAAPVHQEDCPQCREDQCLDQGCDAAHRLPTNCATHNQRGLWASAKALVCEAFLARTGVR